MYATASSLRALGNFHILQGKLSKFALSHSATQFSKCYISFTQHLCSNNDTVEIGGVSKQLKEAKNKELIPTKYENEHDQSTLKKLRWMLQKDNLGQDMFLIGPPGPEKFRIAHTFAQLVNQEVEYVALSRDTTESDLKQRREIRDGTAFFEDQAAVRAAVNGRILILDGIEKAERNVLPVLNNLLENREMPLEDGRFLISASRFDKLLEGSESGELEKWKLLRVDDKFRVIALGLPVPKYSGHPLDPPLRSRFQALNVGPKSFKDQLSILRQLAPEVKEDTLIQVASFAYAVNAPESKAQGLPDFPIDCLPLAAKLLANDPDMPVNQVLGRLYPYQSFLTKDGQNMVHDLMKNLGIQREEKTEKIVATKQINKEDTYVANKYHDGVIAELEESIRIHDICLIGPRGSGKSTLIKQLAGRLSQDIEPIMLYQDMTARDLLQQRSTLPNGDTVWRPSALLNSAIEGKMAILDGLHRLNTGTLFTIHSLIHEREAQLFDGSRILRHDRYDEIQQQLGLSEKDMANRKLLKIHKDFRIVALAEPPNSSGTGSKSTSHWLSPEILSMFLYHSLRPMSVAEEVRILEALIDDQLPSAMHPIISLAQKLRAATDPTLHSLAASLSTRQLLRLAKRLKEYPTSNPYDLVERACLSRFLPRLPQEALIKAMEQSDITKPQSTQSSTDTSMACSVEKGVLTIGRTTVPIYNQGNQAKVPDVVFYDTDQHLRVLELLLQDFLLGDHLLLIGNQGVGKNRLIDRLLALMNRPREYIQLHRDTTVQSLTVQPTVNAGLVTYQDSPLVRAARDGSILVVDEADKAPTQVTCVLKTLIENGEMLLADGRRILPPNVKAPSSIKESDVIRLHPDFRVIVLANRPGFPFLGNDFFAALGDLFSVHAVENPSFDSEIELLRNFGPSLPDATLRSLVRAFSQLRSMADEGQLNYPYSTREVINVVKHLERYPKDGIIRTVSNVFDFDAYSTEVKEMITKVFHEHGIPLGASANNVALATEMPLNPPVAGGEWKILEASPISASRTTLGTSGRFSVRGKTSALPGTEARLLWFTEQKTNWKLPMGEAQIVQQLSVDAGKGVTHVLTTSPSVLYSLDMSNNNLVETPMDRFLDSAFSNRFRLQMACLKDQLAIFDPDNSKLMLLDPAQQNIQPFDFKTASTNSSGSSSLNLFTPKWMTGSEGDRSLTMLGALSASNTLVFYQPRGRRLQLFKPGQMESVSYSFDFDIQSAFLVMNDRILIQPQGSNDKYLFDAENGLLQLIQESQPTGSVTSDIVVHQDASGALFTVENHFGAVMAIPQNTLQLWPGFEGPESTGIALLPQHNLVIRSISVKDAPKSVDRRNASGFLHVSDLAGQTLRYVPIPELENRRRYGNVDTKKIHLAAFDQDSVVTVDADGRIRQWEVNQSRLAKSLDLWRTTIGDDGGNLTIERTQSGDVSSPKVGKIDPKNAPHVGGNTWAGGTGGRDTAGLGGRGGPYRLDAGHDVHQVSEEDIAAVPEEVRRAARDMGQKAYQERLKQIRMNPVDGELYQRFSSSVQKQVQALRVILGNLQAKGKERQWMKHQTFGDLDETKIIEGLTGERNIYRRRAERQPELGTPSEKPKHLRLLVDVSGSMYRFNGYDRRLEREMAATLLFMEALEGHSSRWRYDVIGHSGETLNLELVSADRPPADEKQRLDVLLNMHAHAQFCMSGDHTLEAVKQSIASLSEKNDVIDEAFVIVLSDANLDRYGIPAHHLVRALTATENVRSAVVFIGSLGDQATRLSQKMPAGSAYVCMDLEKLPHILQQIFTSILLSS